MSVALLLGPGVVLPIAHLVVDDEGIKNLRNALGLTPQLPDPNAGETAGAYATRTGTTLSAELPADHRYDPWAIAPDNTTGWWIGPNEPFNAPPGYGRVEGNGDRGVSPIVVGMALEASGYLERLERPLLYVDHVCRMAAAQGAPIFGYDITGTMEGLPSLEHLREACNLAWIGYSFGDESVPQISEEELNAFHDELQEMLMQRLIVEVNQAISNNSDLQDLLNPATEP